jgi:hypothetical protein
VRHGDVRTATVEIRANPRFAVNQLPIRSFSWNAGFTILPLASRDGAALGNSPEAAASLLKMAQDYRDMAEDLDNGAIEIRHAERMPQRKQTH